MGLEGRAPPMSRFVSVCLCAMVAFVSVAGAMLLGPAPALAASGTLTMETPLHESPDHGAPLVTLLPEGTTVSIDGPPVDGFYPVSTDGLSGWMRGETLELAKDIVEEPADTAATPEETAESIPVEQDVSDVPLTADQMAPPADQATDPSVSGEAQSEPASTGDPAVAPAPASVPVAPSQTGEAVTDPATTSEPAADAPMAAPADEGNPPATDAWVSPEPAVAPVPAQPAPSDTTEPVVAPVMPEPASGDAAAVPAPENVDPGAVGAEPVAAAPVPGEMVAAEPAPEPVDSPEPVVAPPPPLGPAGVVVDMPIRTGPGPDYGLIFTVPMGSTVEQTGQAVDGFVSVQYKEVSGWAAAEHMAEASDFVEETPEATAEPVDTKTPRPGSGVAFATIDLSLRSEPSANSEPVVVVPAGSRLVLTGVMEGDFQRVTYGDLIGWIANEYLETPVSPAPNGEATGKQENYSRREVVRLITQAAKRYDQSADDMLRVAQCESNLDPYAVNPSGSYGLFQFIRTTWKSTPYGNEDIFDPRANSNAAAWMWSQGRKSEWVCQ